MIIIWATAPRRRSVKNNIRQMRGKHVKHARTPISLSDGGGDGEVVCIDAFFSRNFRFDSGDAAALGWERRDACARTCRRERLTAQTVCVTFFAVSSPRPVPLTPSVSLCLFISCSEMCANANVCKYLKCNMKQ